MLDNDISHKFAEMLRALDVEVEALRHRMPEDTKDPDFLGDLKKKYGINVFISNNTTQRTKPQEVALLKASGVTSLYFNPFWSKLVFWEQAKWLMKNWEKFEAFARLVPSGTCADIQQNGRLKVFQL